MLGEALIIAAQARRGSGDRKRGAMTAPGKKIRAQLIEGVARIVEPAAFVEAGPRQVTQRNVQGKPVAYDRPSDAELERMRELALETAAEVVDFVLLGLASATGKRR